MSDEQAEALLAPLRELGPEVDTFGRVPAPALARLHMDPEGPTPTATATSMLSLARGSTAALVDVLDEVAGADGRSTVLMGVELRQLGGALARPHPEGGALSHFDGDLIAFAGGMPPDGDTARAMRAAADGVMHALNP